jgi:hypothetical protein
MRTAFPGDDSVSGEETYSNLVVAGERYKRATASIAGLASFSGCGGIAHAFAYKQPENYRAYEFWWPDAVLLSRSRAILQCSVLLASVRGTAVCDTYCTTSRRRTVGSARIYGSFGSFRTVSATGDRGSRAQGFHQ